eukprot:TRINITY_DN7790_c0_g1_i1.p1 TRINITY_DN7790_c0_g1~~TRINITY_DN7790_c0_g1_i1.p1  ORF type:complete len:175 (+),score=41.08 TRINITY_DN7790_c0_g1_i1:72-596(+)
MQITFPEGYEWVVLNAVMICVMCFFTSLIPGLARGRYFTKAFFEKNFPELKGTIPDSGYPDCGSGRYSQKLSHAEWEGFNNAQRVHVNFVENVTTYVVLTLATGLFHTGWALKCSAAIIVGRFAYTLGYTNIGAKGRIPGALLSLLGLIGLVGGAVHGCVTYGGGQGYLSVLMS